EFVAPIVRLLAGLSEEGSDRTRAKIPFRIASENGRTEYVLVRLTADERGDLVAYPIGKGSGSVTTWSQADGYFIVPKHVEQLDENETVLVRSLGGGRAESKALVVIGSHCVGLDILLSRLLRRGITSKLIAVGSEGGLAAVRRGECDVAGMHLYDPRTGTYNAPFLGPGLVLMRGYGRLQGVVFRRGDERFQGPDADTPAPPSPTPPR